MRYPKEVQNKIDFLKEYKENKMIQFFNILHLYPKTLAYPNGYYDSRNFELVGYDTKSMMCKHFEGLHDAIFFHKNIEVDVLQIFADGSTLIKFKTQVTVSEGQAISIFTTG
jgi:hypothetical protein